MSCDSSSVIQKIQIQREILVQLTLEGNLYVFRESESGLSDVRVEAHRILRNCLCHHGKPSRVTTLSISPFLDTDVKTIIVPHSIGEIVRSEDPLRVKCHLGVAIAFEADSAVNRIDNSAFRRFSSLKSICIPASVGTLPESCFTSCTSLQRVTFEPASKLSRIEEGAFSDCSSLKSIQIPASVEILCHSSFSWFNSVQIVTFDPASKLSRIEERAFSSCSSLKSIQIPASVEILCKWCFSDCSSLCTLTFESGSTLIRIKECSFSSCSALTSICIPASVEILCRSCFSHCTSISTLTFESGSKVARIEDFSFFSCSRLTSICIPSSLHYFPDVAFSSCNIRTITLDSNHKSLSVSGGFLVDVSEVILLRYMGVRPDVTVGHRITVLGKGCYRNCAYISSLTFEPVSALVRIQRSAFCSCSSLKLICLPASIDIIPDDVSHHALHSLNLLSNAVLNFAALIDQHFQIVARSNQFVFMPQSKLLGGAVSLTALPSHHSLWKLALNFEKLAYFHSGSVLHSNRSHFLRRLRFSGPVHFFIVRPFAH
jgi:hypothetical protein